MKPALIFLFMTSVAGCGSDVVRQATELFAPRVDLPVGPSPKAVAIVDINGDGLNDIVIARSTPNGAITLLLGRSDGNFGKLEAADRAGDTPFSLAVADLDGDGALDVAVSNYFGAELAALFGRTFDIKTALPADGSHPFALTAVDLDGDGKSDLVGTVQVGDALNVFRNQGSRAFSLATKLALGSTPGGLVGGDLDGDGPGRADVAVTMPSLNFVRLVHGQGGGMLDVAGATDLAVGSGPIAVAAARFDGDDLLDLASANAGDGTVSVLLRNQSSYAAAVNYPVGGGPGALATGDLDGDGFVDIVTSNRVSESISVLRGLSSGRFQAAGDLPLGASSQPEGIAIGDLNGDGLADVVVAKLNADSVALFLSKRPAPAQ